MRKEGRNNEGRMEGQGRKEGEVRKEGRLRKDEPGGAHQQVLHRVRPVPRSRVEVGLFVGGFATKKKTRKKTRNVREKEKTKTWERKTRDLI